MRAVFQLTSSNSPLIIGGNQSLPWTGPADWVCVLNPTASEVLIRATGTDAPLLATADYIVPPASSLSVPINTPILAVVFNTPSALSSNSGGLQSRAEIVVGKSEPLPTIGAYNFATIAESQLSNGAESVAAFGTTLGPYDLGPWGGMAVSVVGGGAQTVCSYYHSADQTTWTRAAIVPIWPGVTYSLQFPRYERYVKLVFDDPGTGGTPSITATVRATITEITDFNVSVANPYAIAFNLAMGANQDFVLATQGLKSAQFVIIGSSSGSIGAQATISYSYDSILYNRFSQVNIVVGTGATTQVTLIENPFPFTKFNLEAQGGAIAGTLYILPSYQVATPIVNNEVAVFDNTVDNRLALVDADIVTNGGKLDTIDFDINQLHVDLNSTIHGDLSITLHNDLNTTIHTDLATTLLNALKHFYDNNQAAQVHNEGTATTGSGTPGTPKAVITLVYKLWALQVSASTADYVQIYGGTAGSMNGGLLWAGYLAAGGDSPLIHFDAAQFWQAAVGTTLWLVTNAASTPVVINAYTIP